jgi:transposase
MSHEVLTSREAAQRLGIAVSTLYDWLAQSDSGTFSLQGQPVTIHYQQTGPRGQGRIKIDAAEVERLREAMQVHPCRQHARRRPILRWQFPGITVPLGRPDD